ncbi:MAG: putative (L31491) ORF2; putative [Plasmid pTOM9] [uncultured Microvirga sp.]|uniref:Putative (L31491) ORF2 putative [Plasmid pTOM9] n=1 Tax=uncultured Microvirga sp. TaxID=412392 RepID=A0A6J4KHX3_9HYPH|nr:MAG: putative (L31491) ORF2; putative [Plasmid pTOM9] [uncultured Microvirga sp.]
MYNSDLPNRAELPSSGQLIRSTLIAAGVAAALLLTVVLPAEYNIDPTGAGRLLGLKQMGEIKQQLHQEADADRLRDQQGAPSPAPAAPAAPSTPPERRSGLVGAVFAEMLIGRANAQTAPATAPTVDRSQEFTLTLKPNEGAEVKAGMMKGAKLNYSWAVEGGTVNHDTHGSPSAGGAEQSYTKGRGVAGDKGVLTAAFDGDHGWFWRNRGSKDVTVKLTATGAFNELKKVK